MSLNFDLTKCCDEAKSDDNAGLKEVVIFACMYVAIGEITKSNLVEFMGRVDIYQRLFGPLMWDTSGDKAVAEPLTLDHVRLFIGLKTNVHRTPPGKWKKQMIDAAEIEAHKAIEKQHSSGSG